MTWTPSYRRSTDRGTVIEPFRTLLATAVDHAGLFPPTGLNMSAAVASHLEHRHGDHAWMLGSFVVPAGRLRELAEARREVAPPHEVPWPVSVLVANPEDGAEAMQLVWTRLAESLRVAAFEVRPIPAGTIREKNTHLRGQAFEGVPVYYEVPLDEEMEERLDAIARVRARAKVRTGGVTPDAFPPAADVVRFLRACAERDLTFKATAGLHHPFAGSYPLTYEQGSACTGMYGFLGLALTAALVQSGGVDDAEAVASLSGGAEDLEVRGDGLAWRGHAVGHGDIVALRRDFFRSFGSCSFDEPVEQLVRAGLLPAARPMSGAPSR